MSSDETFNWPDGDIILRATRGTDNRDFRVHKLFLSFASPVFKDMFMLPQPSSPTPPVDVVEVDDPPQALEATLHFIYPTVDPPAIDDLSLLLEVLILADKYDIKAVRYRLRLPLAELSKTEPLRVYAIACRLGWENEMKVASSYTTSINLPDLTELPDEFKSIPATEYHRLIRLHTRYRDKVAAIAADHPPPSLPGISWAAEGLGRSIDAETAQKVVIDAIKKGAPLDSDTLMRPMHPLLEEARRLLSGWIQSILDKANALNLTV